MLRAGREAGTHGSVSFGRSSHPGDPSDRIRHVAAARRFGISIASAVRWMEEYLRTGWMAPKPRGGDRRSGRIEAQADLLLRVIEETPDITLAELRERLIAERGETFALSTIHDFCRR
jgi:transposase